MARHGWACDEKRNAVIFSLKKVYKWRSTTWWQSQHTRVTKEDPENLTRWKHKSEWHNRGNAWDKMATCSAGKKDWLIARRAQNSPEDKYNFITYILNKMKLPTEDRKTENKDKEKRLKKRTPSELGSEDITVHTREGGPTVQLCGDSNVACK